MSKAVEATQTNTGSLGSDEVYDWTSKWDIEPHGFSADASEPFCSEDTPHKPPLYNVELKLAADIEIINDIGLVNEVAEHWFPSQVNRFTQAAAVVFNDASVWYLPLATWEKDYEGIRTHLVNSFIPDIVQWKAIVDGRDPSEALEQYRDWNSIDEKEWVDDVDDTDMPEDYRQWFNDNVDWVGHISREIESSSDNVDLDVDEDDSWTDDW